MQHNPLPQILTLLALALYATGASLGDGELGFSASENYKPVPQCIQSDNSFKPCQQ